ncbi:MAG: RNase P subunit p30 family protein [Candidatus Njordarchaeia archaeon]
MRKRAYFDLHILPKSGSDLIEMVAMAKHMGYSGVGVSITHLVDEIGESVEKIGELERKLDINILIKVDEKKTKSIKSVKLDPLKTLYYRVVENEKDFRKQLNKKDLNILTVPIGKLADVLNINTLNLLKQTDKAVEVTVKQLWLSNPIELQRIIKSVQKVIWLLNKRANIYVASGAENTSEMRNPIAIRSILKLLDIKDQRTIEMLSTIPQNIVKITKPIIIIDKTNKEKNS